MRLSAFKNIAGFDKAGLKALDSGDQVGLYAHNSLLQIANASYGSATAWGAGIGAGYGALDGAFSYDGSFFGGAFHGAMMGAAGGAGLRATAGTYAKGAVRGIKPYEGSTGELS